MKCRWFQNLLFDVLEKVLFPRRAADGFSFPELFKPMLLKTIALAYAAVSAAISRLKDAHCYCQIRCALDEWQKGERNKVPFESTVYEPIYRRHYDNLKALQRFSKPTVDQLRQEAWQRAS